MIPHTLKGNKYALRLAKEWKQHSKIVLALDFDSTISYWNTIENQLDIQKTIDLVKEAQKLGVYTVIFTACHPDRYPEIIKHCTNIGLKIDSINENPFNLPYGNHGKIYYNHLLDDRAGLEHALDILEFALYSYKGYLEEIKIINNGDVA